MKRLEVESEAAGAAIRALGSLFKVSEVYIWDDGTKYTRLVFDSMLQSNKTLWFDDADDDDVGPNLASTSQDCSPVLEEDEELTKQMNALGLPLSFNSSKEKMSGTTKGRRKGTRKKHSHGSKETKDEALELSQVSEGEILYSVSHGNSSNSLCCMSMLRKSESSYCGVAVDASESICPSGEGEDSVSSVRIVSSSIKQQTSDVVLPVMSQNDVYVTITSNNLEAELSPEFYLKQAGLDNGKKEVGEQIMEYDGCEACSRVCLDEEGEKFYDDSSTKQPSINETAAYNPNTEMLDQENIGSCGCDGDFGEWKVYWDSFYRRNYFYNIRTRVSTWHPPPGMENIAFVDSTEKSDEMIKDVTKVDLTSCSKPEAEDAVGLQYNTELYEGYTNDNRSPSHLSDELSVGVGLAADCCLSNMNTPPNCSLTSTPTEAVSNDIDMHVGAAAPDMDRLDAHLDFAVTKQKKKARRKVTERKISNETEEVHFQGIFEGDPANLHKYWRQRYLLFSKFDDGIKMDEEGWFSVTPEPIARHHAARCGTGIIVDCFTGVGGNAIQFAQRSKHVIAIDVDPKKITYAYHNAAIYGVDDQIDFIKGDFFLLAPKLKADTVFLSPPWGGPDYAKVKSYDIKTMLKPHDGYLLFNTAKAIASIVVLFLPRNVDLNQLAELSLSSHPPWSLEVEKNFLNGRLKSITAYFSDTTVREQ